MVAVSHLLAHLAAMSVANFQDHNLVLLGLPLSSRHILGFFCFQIGVKPLIAEHTRDMAVMPALVGYGFGNGIASIRPHSKLSPDGRKLLFLPLTDAIRTMKLGLILTGGAVCTLTVRALAVKRWVNGTIRALRSDNAPPDLCFQKLIFGLSR